FALSLPCFLAGAAMLVWSFGHLVAQGTWIKWAAFAGGAGLALGVAVLFFGFMADIATRLRQNQEEILYWLRRQAEFDDLTPGSLGQAERKGQDEGGRAIGGAQRRG